MEYQIWQEFNGRCYVIQVPKDLDDDMLVELGFLGNKSYREDRKVRTFCEWEEADSFLNNYR